MRVVLLSFTLLGLLGLGAADDACKLLKGDPQRCYKYNANSCCISAHDSVVKGDTCLRSYPTLESYFCMGCHPDSKNFIDNTNKKIKICQSFIKILWPTPDPADSSKSIGGASTVYDNCGFLTGDSSNPVIIPSKQFANVTNFFEQYQPPFLEGYKVVIVDDSVDKNCFTSFSPRVMSQSFLLLAVVLALTGHLM